MSDFNPSHLLIYYELLTSFALLEVFGIHAKLISVSQLK